MTPEEAAGNAAEILGEALRNAIDPERSAAMVAVADGWTRLHTALKASPSVTVNMSDTTIKDPDPLTIGYHWHNRREPEPAPGEPVEIASLPADAGFADREIARLQDYLTTQFPLPKGTPGPDDTPVDVAIDLLTREVLRRDAVEIVDRTGPLLTELRNLTAGWPRIQRDRSEDDL